MPRNQDSWRGLVSVSREMKLALEVVLRLVGERQHSAPVAELATAMGVPVEALKGVLARLVHRGIVHNGAANKDIVSLLAPVDDLTLADVADATDEWLTVARCDDDPEDGSPGLSEALSLVRERATEGLREVRLARFAQAQL